MGMERESKSLANTDYALELLDATARYSSVRGLHALGRSQPDEFRGGSDAYTWDLDNLARLAVEQLAESLRTAQTSSPNGVPVRAVGFPADARWRWGCDSCAATGHATDPEHACRVAWLHLREHRVP
jgi:hypothetical protein